MRELSTPANLCVSSYRAQTVSSLLDDSPIYEIRGMRREDISAVLNIRRSAGFPQGQYVLPILHEIQPEAFFVAVNREGEVIGSCGGLIINEDLGYPCYLAVKSNWQGFGIGRELWQRSVERIGERNAYLEADSDGLHVYRDKRGFSVVSDWSIHVCMGRPTFSNPKTIRDIAFTTGKDCNIEEVCYYDYSVHGYDRKRFLSTLFKTEQVLSLVAFEGGKVCGYGALQEDILGFVHLSSLYADDVHVAVSLIRELFSRFPPAKEKELVGFFCGANRSLLELIDRLNLRVFRLLKTCYKRPFSGYDYDKIYSY